MRVKNLISGLVGSELVIQVLSTGFENLQFFLKHVNEYAGSIEDSPRPFSKQTWEDAHKLWVKNTNKK